ncbi:extracellular solute-binding protein [Kribbella sp. NPDC026596]|uniref:extracellular solute-binding protein n=1 Tax=Kribbella sp. NPDC026596 TaxID=3155122 RepID=UPI00340D0CC7
MSAKAVVTVWMYPVISQEQAATAYWTQIEKDFEAANAAIDLRIEQQPWANRDQKLATAFSGGKGPDVLLLGPDQGVEALTFLKTLYDAGAIPKSALSNANVVADQAFRKQQVAMGFTNTLIDAKTVTASWGAANVIVGVPLENKKRVGFGLPGGLAVNAGSKDVEAAGKFLTFMTQPKQVISLGTAANFLSPRTDAPVPATDEQSKKFEEALQYAYSGEVNPAARQVMALVAVEIQAVLTGDAAAGPRRRGQAVRRPAVQTALTACE